MEVFRGLFSRATLEMCRDFMLRMELYSVIDPSLEDTRGRGGESHLTVSYIASCTSPTSRTLCTLDQLI